MSIKSKLTTVFLTIAAVPMLLVGVMNFVYSQQTITTDTLNSLEQLSIGIEDLILKEVENNKTRFDTLKADTEIISAFTNPNEDTPSLLNQKISQYPDILSIFLLDPSGNPIASNNEETTLPKYLKNPTPLNEGKLNVDIVGVIPGQWDLVTTAVIKQKKQQLGILVIISDARPFTRITSDFVGFGKTGDIIITAPDKEGNIKFVSPRRFEDDPEAKNIISKELLSSEDYELFTGKEKSYSSARGYRDKLVLGISRPIEELGWNVILKIDRKEALAQLDTMKKTLLYLMVATLFTVILLALYFSKSMTHPIKLLSEALTKVDKGDLNMELQPTTNDELKELTLSFNAMVKSIREQEQEKYNFITSASHQLRTPSSALNWQLSMLQEIADKQAADPVLAAKGGKELKNLVKDIKQNNQGTVTVIDDLLKVLELGDKYSPTDTKEIEIQKLVDIILESYKNETSQKNITIKQDIQKDIKITGNEAWLKEVFINLIDNAITYSNQEGEIRISVQKEAGKIKIQIADDGIGIPKKQHLHVFDKFFRAENAYIKKNVGSGLGLVIAKTVVEGHGGSISFTSDEDSGMVVTIFIPC